MSEAPDERIPYPTDKPFDEAMDALERALEEREQR